MRRRPMWNRLTLRLVTAEIPALDPPNVGERA